VIALPLGIVAALAASGESTRLQLDVAFAIDARSLSATPPPVAPPPGHSVGEDIGVRATIFHRRVVDDDAAPALQPYLQRLWSFSVAAGGSAGDMTYPFYVLNPVAPSALALQYHSTDRAGYGSLSAAGYVGRYLHLGVRFGIRYDRFEPALWGSGATIGGFGNITPISSGAVSVLDSSELALDGAASLGVRWRDVLVSAGWAVAPYRIGDAALHVRFWGGAFVDIRAVIRRRIDLAAHVQVLDGGALVDGSATVWLRRRFGLVIGGEGGHGAFADSPTQYDRAGGYVGVAWWLAPRVAVALRYAPAWQSPMPLVGLGFVLPNSSMVQHVVTLQLTGRPRTAR
jgi:hypothetical protein